MRFEFDIDLKGIRYRKVPKEKKIKKEPVLRRHLILAYQLEQFFETKKINGLREASTWLNMTHARISQIMSLLSLAPFIKEEVLLSDDDIILNITERGARHIAMEIDWQKQKDLWEDLKES